MDNVQPKIKHRPFCFSVKGHVKMLRLALTVTSMTFFIIAQAPEPYIVITGFEVTVILFFILLYILRLDRLMKWLFWPLLDIINSLVTTVFMLIVSVLALIPETTTLTVGGGRRSFTLLTRMVSIFQRRDPPASVSQSAGITGVCTCDSSMLSCRRGPYLPEASIQSQRSLPEKACA
ncbi:chemokine-like factor isoform X1 [Symphalangus syndactylus]|uniref:chemokine-like factor isoform X1 n=1 Tax=Symphalangus syndactylus TaxID=9590 RepID=UPI00244122AC|nr:chemokine-like factor isoform X1 [Symphalangus syndactylus]